MFFLFGSEHALVDFIRDLFFQDTVCSFVVAGLSVVATQSAHVRLSFCTLGARSDHVLH